MRSDTTEFPKVLLVSSSVFNEVTGGGITLGKFFSGWPKGRIAAVHSDPQPPTRDICDNYYELRNDELGFIGPIDRILRLRNGRRGGAPLPSAAAVGTSRPRAVIRFARSLKDLIAREGLRDRATLTPALMKWLDEFKPDVIYTLLGTLGYLRLVKKIAEYTGAPVVIHMMDDWPAVRYKKGILAPYFRRQMKSLLQASMNSASATLGICPSMCREYTARYGRPFATFSNAIDTSAWAAHSRTEWSIESPARLLYAGSVMQEAQLASLKTAAAAVEELAADGKPMELVIRTPMYRDTEVIAAFEQFSATRIGGPLLDGELAPYLAKSAALLLPVNFDEESARYVRYSNPTKMPVYMISGTPILAFGPAFVDQVDRVAKGGWGLAVTENDVKKLKTAITELLGDPALRERLGRKAQETARNEHDLLTMQADFRNMIREAAAA